MNEEGMEVDNRFSKLQEKFDSLANEFKKIFEEKPSQV